MSEDRLQKALDFANYRQTLNNQLQKLKIRTEGMLMFAEAGGKFTINRELICCMDYLVRNGQESATIFDDNGYPVQIADTALFLKKITERYSAVANDYLQEAQEIKKSRKVGSILDIKEE